MASLAGGARAGALAAGSAGAVCASGAPVSGWVAARNASLRAPAQAASSRVAVVVGNEAGDVDSLVSAVVLAFCWPRLVKPEHEWTAVPVGSIARKDFKLRGDARLLFDRAGWPMDEQGAPRDLLFLDDLAAAPREAAELVLTDHNAPCAALSALWGGVPRVAGVVDHHADAGLFRDAALRRVDPSAGSCCSLVAQLALEHGVALPPALATLLVGTILLDTRHFSDKAKRFSPVDVQAHRMLLAAHARDLPPEQEHAAWFEALMAARQDTGELSAADMLKLDTKSSVLSGGPFKGRRLAISSVMATLPEMLERAGGPDALEREMRAFRAADHCDALVCLMSPEKMEDGKKRKGLTLHGDKHLIDAVAKIVKDCPANLSEELRSNPLFAVQGIPEKGFSPKPHPSLPPLPFWAATVRGDTTRKTLMPTIIDLLGASNRL